MYQQTVNWNRLLSKATSNTRYATLMLLKEYFKDDPIDYFTLLEYAIKRSGSGTTLYQKYSEINFAVNNVSLKIPSQYNTAIRQNTAMPTIKEVLRFFKENSQSHSSYAYLACMYHMDTKELPGIKLQDYPYAFYGLPKWLDTVLYRQYRLCRNAGITDEGPFFFRQRGEYTYQTKDNAAKTAMAFQIKFGITYAEYLRFYHYRIGLEKNAAIFYGTNPDVLEEIRKRRRRNLLHAVAIYGDVKDRARMKVFDYGVCLQEIETGIYLVHATTGIYIVPFQLLDMPLKNIETAKNFLRKEKYATGEEVDSILKQKDLIRYTVRRKRLE